MYVLNEIRHNIVILCHRNYVELKKTNYVLEIDYYSNYSKITKKIFGCPLIFESLGVQMTPRHSAGSDLDLLQACDIWLFH